MYHQDRTSPLLNLGLGRCRVTRERWIKGLFREFLHTRDAMIKNHSKEASILFYSVAKNIPIVIVCLLSVDPYELKQPVSTFSRPKPHVCSLYSLEDNITVLCILVSFMPVNKWLT